MNPFATQLIMDRFLSWFIYVARGNDRYSKLILKLSLKLFSYDGLVLLLDANRLFLLFWPWILSQKTSNNKKSKEIRNLRNQKRHSKNMLVQITHFHIIYIILCL